MTLLRRALAPITSLGWTIAAIGAVSWWVGARLGWEELLIIAGACLVALLLALLATVGRLALHIDVDVEPPRVVVGGDAVGRVRVVNPRGRLALGSRVEVPVGAGVAVFEVGALGAGERYEEPFVVPTHRRSIIPVGPARSIKGDALGIARREVVSGRQVDLYVHPRTTVLPSFSAGWIRDLEGRTTNDLSPSDVAFHTLREYVPGDDRRHIHWRTTARLGTLMVRQFVDTRRSHLGIVLSTDATDWIDDEEFELGVSVVGSLGRTALVDEQEVTVLSGSDALASQTPQSLLDALSGVEQVPDGLPLRELARRSLPAMRSVSVLALVVGSDVDPRFVRLACESYGSHVTVVALRCRVGAEASRRRIGNVSLVEVGRLDDLARVLALAGTGR
ncbi:DUF58 domain-containing protein [Actinomarinicola tropica]|uniref:DUF58 domain-containing protein n=1 Tax=Actinomarinicola tropica TaxID=2789776 RepID=A0A5Q2RKA2_9ACTN|nr:DUF58 domain-containing protein [Actinomarinicola tropica]QGG93635.1 DUF58 domain-containing protein [Actinomarinicola tropica]